MTLDSNQACILTIGYALHLFFIRNVGVLRPIYDACLVSLAFVADEVDAAEASLIGPHVHLTDAVACC